MVDVVGQFAFDAYLFLLLLQRCTVFAVAVDDSLLKTRVQTHDIAGDFTQFVMWKAGRIVYAVAGLGMPRKVA